MLACSHARGQPASQPPGALAQQASGTYLRPGTWISAKIKDRGGWEQEKRREVDPQVAEVFSTKALPGSETRSLTAALSTYQDVDDGTDAPCPVTHQINTTIRIRNRRVFGTPKRPSREQDIGPSLVKVHTPMPSFMLRARAPLCHSDRRADRSDAHTQRACHAPGLACIVRADMQSVDIRDDKDMQEVCMHAPPRLCRSA